MRSSDSGLMTLSAWRGALVALVALALLGSAAPGMARTWVVDDDRAESPTADFTTVGAAVTAAASGDTIRLSPGMYRENVTVLNKSILFQGDGADRVIVDGNPGAPAGTSPSFVNVFTLRATNGRAFVCRFAGMTIRRGRYGIWAQDTETGGGQAGSSMAVDISYCVFVHNGYDGIPYVSPGSTVSSDYTVHATDGGAVRGEGDGSRVADSQFQANDRAIQFEFGQRLQITGNEIFDNVQAGINLGRLRPQGSAAPVIDVTVSGNRVRGNFDAGIRVSGAVRATVESNVVEQNWNSGIVAYDCDGLTVRRNRVSENSSIEINGLGSLTPDAFGGVAILNPAGPIAVSENIISANHIGLFTQTAGGVRVVGTLNAAVTLTGNHLFANDGDGVAIEGNSANVKVTGNNITNNRGFGVNNLGTGNIDATQNWWASANGPRAGPANADNPEQVNGRLVSRPWAIRPLAYPEIRLTPAP